MAKTPRLDKLLVERKLVPSREKAQSLILSGRVIVDGTTATKAGTGCPADAIVEIIQKSRQYVSRGGVKLAHALDVFEVSPKDRICLDVGSSTGGFTEVLLLRGASRVVAIDVGKGQLDWTLRKDPRVTVMENANARYLTGESISGRLEGEWPDLVVVDVSFISVQKVLRPVLSAIGENAEMVVLAKPQFEVGKGKVGKGGIVRDPSLQKEALTSIWNAAEAIGLGPAGVTASPIRGAKGNREFFFHLVSGVSSSDREISLDAAMSE